MGYVGPVTFVLIVLAVIFLLDLLCLILTVKLLRGRWRWFAIPFVLAQIVGLGWLVASRFSEAIPDLPIPLLAVVYLWHLVGISLFLVVATAAIGVAVWSALRKALQSSPTAAPQATDQYGMSRREFLGTAAALTPPLVVTGLTAAALTKLDHFRIRQIDIPLPQLPAALDGMTIAHVSDMHVGPFTSGAVLREIVQATNGLRADLVLLTGDLINHALDALPEAIEVVKAMEAKLGVWTIEGNHDLIENGREFERRMRTSGVNFLLNESATLHVHGQSVQLLGLQWVPRRQGDYEAALSEAVRELLSQRNADAFPLLLAHHPHAFDTAARHGIPLTLSGHTHGGQLMLNENAGFGPAMFRYWSGLSTLGDSRIVVSNGVGNWFPLRVNAPAEILHLTLRRS